MPNTVHTKETLLTVPDIAKRLKVPVQTIYNWINKGRLHPVKLGKSVRFTWEELERIKKEGL